MKSALLVDDNQELISIMKELLPEAHPFESIIVAFNGSEALNKIDRQEFDLVILDLNMPRLGGMEVLKYLDQKKVKTQVLMCSGALDEETLTQAHGMGVKHFLTKPFTTKEFIEKIKSL